MPVLEVEEFTTFVCWTRTWMTRKRRKKERRKKKKKNGDCKVEHTIYRKPTRLVLPWLLSFSFFFYPFSSWLCFMSDDLRSALTGDDDDHQIKKRNEIFLFFFLRLWPYRRCAPVITHETIIYRCVYRIYLINRVVYCASFIIIVATQRPSMTRFLITSTWFLCA